MKSSKSIQEKNQAQPSTNSSPDFSIIVTDEFIKAASALKKKYPNIGDDFHALKNQLKKNPLTGHAHVKKDVYKIRMRISDKKTGERDSARVIVEIKIKDKVVYVLYVYDKSELSDIDEKYLDGLIANPKPVQRPKKSQYTKKRK